MRHRKLPELPTGFLAWLRPVMATPKERVLQVAGLDAYMLLRYIRMCLKICCFSGFFGLVVLVPLYLHGNRAKPYDGSVHAIMADPKLISMGNIKELHFLWVPIFFAYLTTFHTLYLLKREYKQFLTLRLTFLSVGDPDVDIQKSFSVLVDRIPLEYRSNTGLYALFDEIFPGDVHSAVVALRVDSLEDLVAERATTVDCLERALATRSVTRKEPLLFLPEEGRLWSRLRRKGQHVEAVEHYQRQLDTLNQKITNVQIMIRQASDDLNRREEVRQESRRQLHQQHNASQTGAMAAGLLHGVSSRRVSVSPLVMGNAESRSHMMSQKPVDELLAIQGTINLDTEGEIVVIDDEAGDTSRVGGVPRGHSIRTPSTSTRRNSLGGSSMGTSSTSVHYHQAPHSPPAGDVALTMDTSLPSSKSNGNGNGNGIGKSAAFKPTLVVNAPSTVAEEEPDDALYSTPTAQEEADVARRDIPKQSRFNLVKQAVRKALRFGKTTGQNAVEAGQEAAKAISLLAINTNMSSTGFVTFKSMTSAAVASQSLLTMEPFMFTINPAPEPRDVVWQNLAAPLRLVEWREASTTIVITFLSLFWGALVSALYKLQSQLQVWSSTDVAMEQLGYWGKFFLYLGIDYVPTLLLLIILAILPNIFWALARHYERLRTFSDIDASVMSRYFYYQMVNIYATIVGGALLDEVVAIARDPRVVVRVLGCQVPVVAVYFMQVIVTKAFSAVMWEFSRAWPLIRVTFLHWFTNYDRKTARQRRAPLYRPYMAYGWTYPSLLLVLTICLTYDVIMPVTLLLGAVYFFFVEILYTYHLLYVYVPQFEGGGRMWYKVFNRTLVALLLSHLTLIGYMAVLGAGNLVPVLVPLPCVLVPFYRHCQNGYQEASQKLSLLAARRIDDCLREEDVEQQAPAAAPAVASPPGSPPPAPAAGTEEGKNDTRTIGSPTPTSGLGRRRRSTMAITPDGDEIEVILPAEPPIVVDYFQISAYAQPCLTEGPQEAEILPWHRQNSGGGDPEQPDGPPGMAGEDSVGPRPTSLNQSASSALAKRLKISEALEDLRVPLSPLALDMLQSSTGGADNRSTISSGMGPRPSSPMGRSRQDGQPGDQRRG